MHILANFHGRFHQRLLIGSITCCMSSLLLLVPPNDALAQFPLSAPVTGDTIYSNLILDVHDRMIGSFPWNNGSALVVLGTDDGTRFLELNDAGVVVDDHVIGTPVFQASTAAVGPDGLYVAGNKYGWPGQAVLAKVSSDLLSYQWVDTTGLLESCTFVSIECLQNGDVLGTGYRRSPFNVHSPYIRRLTSSGTHVWTYAPAPFIVELGQDARELSDGTILIAGINSTSQNSQDAYAHTIKLGASGTFLTDEDFGAPGSGVGEEVMAHPNGNSVIWGIAGSVGMMAEVDDQGVPVWIHPISGWFQDGVYDTTASSYVITGRMGAHALVARWDLQGNMVWSHSHGDSTAIGVHIRQDDFGGFIITGTVGQGTFVDPRKPYLLRVDADGITGLQEASARPRSKLQIVPNPSPGNAVLLSSTVGSEAWNSRDLKSRPH